MGTPNLDLEYLDPSQAQPEVKINDAWDKIDAAVGTVAVSDTTTSPPIVAHAREIKFSGATVTHETNGVAHVAVVGGGSIDVSDGTTEVTGVTEIRFTRGASISMSSGSVADVYIDPVSGGAGGGGNETPYSHPLMPDATNDEFEELTLDPKWTVRNLTGTATVTLADGSISLLADTVTGDNNLAVTEPIAAPTSAWQYDFAGVFCINGSAGGSNSSFGAIVKGGTKYVKFGGYTSGSGTGGFLVQRLTTLTAFASNPLVGSGGAWPYRSGNFSGNETVPIWLRLVYDGSTNILFYASNTGHANTWALMWTEPVATFLGTPATDIGVNSNSGNAIAVRMFCDAIRKTA